MTLPISARCNNPLNIRPGQPYEGLAVPAQAGGFCVFQSPVWGFRAAFRNYITKYDRGVDTIAKLIGEWAPPGDNNNTAAYIASVCNATGFAPNEQINLKSWDVCSLVCYAQAVVEGGQPFEQLWRQADMAEGALRAGIVDAPKTPIRKAAVIATSAASAVCAAAPTIVDTINAYRPSIESSSSQVLKTAFGVAAVVFAMLAIFNHIRSNK